jgi:hypoxanthine phosphoribosyltransferase
MNSTTIHDQMYEYHSWGTLGEEIFILSKKILESGKKFDRVIALAKGGLTFSRSLVDYLSIKELSTFQIEFYTGVGTTNKTPVITQSLPVSIRDEHILVFDDVVDRGETLKLATEYLKYHGAQSITTAVLITKPWTKVQADFFARETDAWVIFPNESREHIQLLKKIWSDSGDSKEQIVENLLQIGLPKAEVELFVDIE